MDGGSKYHGKGVDIPWGGGKKYHLFNSIFNKIGYNCFIIFQDYLNIKILKYDENFEIL
jgi:hypothetical protein